MECITASSTYSTFFLDLPSELTSVILLWAGPKATMTLKSVNQQHATYIRSLDQSDLCKHWYIRVDKETGYTAPPYARKLKIDVDQFKDLFKSMINDGVFISPTECNRDGTIRTTVATNVGDDAQQSQPNKEAKITTLWLWCRVYNHFVYQLDALLPFPSTLTHLRVMHQLIPSIGRNQLPNTLTVLDLTGNESLTTIEDNVLPETLEELKLSYCHDFRQLPSTLPPRLEVLNCHETSLDQECLASLVLPDTLRVLDVSSIELNENATLPKLPDGLCELYLDHWHNITHFPFHTQNRTFPSQLRVLNVSMCSKIERLPTPLPLKLSILNCGHCKGLLMSDIPALPPTLRILSLSGIQNDMEDAQQLMFSRFPSSLRSLELNSLRLTTLPHKLYETFPYLQNLRLEYNRLQQLPSPLPKSLKNLDISFNQLTHLPILPLGLTILSVIHNQLTQLPSLPPHLKWLFCTRNKLTELPSLPQSLEEIAFHKNNMDCRRLEVELEALGIKVIIGDPYYPCYADEFEGDNDEADVIYNEVDELSDEFLEDDEDQDEWL